MWTDILGCPMTTNTNASVASRHLKSLATGPLAPSSPSFCPFPNRPTYYIAHYCLCGHDLLAISLSAFTSDRCGPIRIRCTRKSHHKNTIETPTNVTDTHPELHGRERTPVACGANPYKSFSFPTCQINLLRRDVRSGRKLYKFPGH